MEQSSMDSNQEIVVRFNTNSISAEEAKVAISDITAQLTAIGVEDVQISDVIDGKVKFTYYSALDVGVIKNLLYRHNKLDLGDTAFNEKGDPSQFPFGDNSQKYRLEVIKIQTDSGSDIGFQGLLVEVKSFADQYLKPRLALTASEIYFNPTDNFERIDPIIYPHLPELITQFEHKIPEVRAGPLC